MNDNENRQCGTAEAWRRLIEELSKQGEGKFMVTMNGRQPVSMSRITQPLRLTEREARND